MTLTNIFAYLYVSCQDTFPDSVKSYPPRGRRNAMSSFFNIIWLLFLISFIIPIIQRRLVDMKRFSLIDEIEKKRKSRLITLIHRQESLSFLGIPLVRFIDIEDSERVLRAIRLTPPEMPIDLMIHTPGGLVLAAEQIAAAVKKHPAKVTVIVPHYAMSGGTLIALAADEIVMDPNAVLGPVDPQIGDSTGAYPAASILEALKTENPNRDDKTLILGDIAAKAIEQMHDTVNGLLKDEMAPNKAKSLSDKLTQGYWVHGFPIFIDTAKELGLPVTDEFDKVFYSLMDYYPQASTRRPAVEYIPIPYRPFPQRKGRGKG